MKNIDIDKWILNNNIDPLTEIIADGKQWFLTDIIEKYLKEQFTMHDVMNNTLTEICLDIFESGIELGKKIGQDTEGKLISPKKGTTITEMVQFQKIYDEVIKKYCS